jgi:hypothetical protein
MINGGGINPRQMLWRPADAVARNCFQCAGYAEWSIPAITRQSNMLV